MAVASTARAAASNVDDRASASSGRTWGQQCSPHCGCVLRFEAQVDEKNKIQSCTYHAKTVMTTRNAQGELEPQRTFGRGQQQVLFQKCNCSTLHQLANEVVNHVHSDQKKTMTQVRNELEFSTVRSSLAFSHAVLHKHDLPQEDTHCLDLVEESLTAMVKGHLPKPRRSQHSSFAQVARHQFAPATPTPTPPPATIEDGEDYDQDEEDDTLVGRYGRVLRQFQALQTQLDPLASVTEDEAVEESPRLSALDMYDSSLSMYDLAYDGPEVQYLLAVDKEEETAAAAEKAKTNSTNRIDEDDATTTMKMDELEWESHVDELYQEEESVVVSS